MAISKLIFNGVIQMDVTGTTADENSVLSGYGAVGSDGQWFDGIASGGGGGLEYETGTYEPETDEQAPTIYFANTHTTEPMYAQIADAESSTATALSYIVCLSANSGAYDDDPRTWGQARRSYINSSNNVTGSNTTFSSIYNVQVFMTNTYYKPAGSNTGYYFRAGRTYKWIAVWAPT